MHGHLRADQQRGGEADNHAGRVAGRKTSKHASKYEHSIARLLTETINIPLFFMLPTRLINEDRPAGWMSEVVSTDRGGDK